VKSFGVIENPRHHGSRRLIRHDDRAGGGEHAAHALADRDPGIGDLRGGNAAHLAHSLLQCVHAGMHVGQAPAIGVERQFAAGGGVALGDEGPGLAARPRVASLAGRPVPGTRSSRP
jgi:DNA-binding transcriptional LysR family regulator